jgi:hypothetical protein
MQAFEVLRGSIIFCLFFCWMTPAIHSSPFTGSQYFQQLFQLGNLEKHDQQANDRSCCYPPQWQGYLFSAFVDETPGTVVIYQDWKNTRFAMETLFTRWIVIFNLSAKSATIYTVDKVNEQCYSGKVGNVTYEDVVQPCLDNSQFIGNVQMGDELDHTDSTGVSAWVQPNPNGVTYGRVVSRKSCVPVYETWFGPHGPSPSGSMFSLDGMQVYFGVVSTIVDPSVFTPPPYCKFQEQVGDDFKRLWPRFFQK